MTDARKRAHSLIEHLAHRISRTDHVCESIREERCTACLLIKQAHAALDEACEEARSAITAAYEEAIAGEQRRHVEALAAERERTLKEVLAALAADDWTDKSHPVRLVKALLKEPAQENLPPICCDEAHRKAKAPWACRCSCHAPAQEKP